MIFRFCHFLPKAFLENYRKQFEDCKNEFLDHFKGDLRLEQKFVDRIERLIDYNCHGGKNNRARSLVRMVKSISENQKKPFNAKLKQKTYVLACCIEILQSSLLVADDIADNSSLRRGKPCWYKCEDIKMDAVNDSYILESLVYFILKKHFSEETIYVRLVDLHRDVILKTQIGQMIDLSFKGYPKNVMELCQRFSYKNFESIITFKTAYYTYFIPIMDALLLCGMHSKEQENAALKIAIELGKKFQIQDDFIDCYGDPSELGKIGKDIEENKCTWLVVKALEKATEAQKKIILENYGRESEKSRDRIKLVYDQINLRTVYLEQEKESYQKIKNFMAQNDEIIPKKSLLPMLTQIHLRKF